MLMDRYAEAVHGLINKVYDTQKEAIIKAADLIVDAVAKGGNVHVFDTGHIINSELINRAGGLALLKQLKYTLQVENPVREIDRKGITPCQEGLGKLVLTASKAAPGDVLIVGSVSGKTTNVIDIALAAKELGIHVIAYTSIEYSSAVKSDHSSGKRLFEIGDVVIDNCAPKGDAMLTVEGIENKFGPASGLSGAFAMWCMSACIVEKMLERGLDPTLFRSVNFPGGWENYREMCDKYANTGR